MSLCVKFWRDQKSSLVFSSQLQPAYTHCYQQAGRWHRQCTSSDPQHPSITSHCGTTASPCTRTEKGVTRHSQNHEIFTQLHEAWHWLRIEPLAQCVMCHFRVKEKAIRNKEKLWHTLLMQSTPFLLAEVNLSFCGSSSTGENTWSGLATSNTFCSSKKNFLEMYP